MLIFLMDVARHLSVLFFKKDVIIWFEISRNFLIYPYKQIGMSIMCPPFLENAPADVICKVNQNFLIFTPKVGVTLHVLEQIF